MGRARAHSCKAFLLGITSDPGTRYQRALHCICITTHLSIIHGGEHRHCIIDCNRIQVLVSSLYVPLEPCPSREKGGGGKRDFIRDENREQGFPFARYTTHIVILIITKLLSNKLYLVFQSTTLLHIILLQCHPLFLVRPTTR